MKKLMVSIIALAGIVIGVTPSIIIAQAGQVSVFYAYKSCVNDSECGDDGYCVNGQCIKNKEKKNCVDDSDCGDDGYCVGGECQKNKGW